MAKLFLVQFDITKSVSESEILDLWQIFCFRSKQKSVTIFSSHLGSKFMKASKAIASVTRAYCFCCPCLLPLLLLLPVLIAPAALAYCPCYPCLWPIALDYCPSYLLAYCPLSLPCLLPLLLAYCLDDLAFCPLLLPFITLAYFCRIRPFALVL
jgi:hypothetical protein